MFLGKDFVEVVKVNWDCLCVLFDFNFIIVVEILLLVSGNNVIDLSVVLNFVVVI